MAEFNGLRWLLTNLQLRFGLPSHDAYSGADKTGHDKNRTCHTDLAKIYRLLGTCVP